MTRTTQEPPGTTAIGELWTRWRALWRTFPTDEESSAAGEERRPIAMTSTAKLPLSLLELCEKWHRLRKEAIAAFDRDDEPAANIAPRGEPRG